MIKEIRKQVTVTTTSVAVVDTPTGKVEVPIVYMVANMQPDGTFSINEGIQDKAVYLKHKQTARDDYNAFRDYVEALAEEEK